MDTLKPVEVSEYYIQRIAKGMKQYFWDNIFAKIFEILDETVVENSKNDLLRAIKQGTIWYEKGAFKTKTRFSNSVALELEKMGARYVRGTYVIPLNNLSPEFINAISYMNARTEVLGGQISDFLVGLDVLLSKVTLDQYISASVDLAFKKLQLDIVKSAQEKKVPVIELGIVKPKTNLPKEVMRDYNTYWKERDKKALELQKSLEKARKNGEETSEIREALTEFRKESYKNAPQYEFKIDEIQLDENSRKIAEDYTYNLNYWVKKWEAKDIVKMRKDIISLVQQGKRVPEIKEYFEKRWKIAGDKAKFLAVNESNLAGSVIKATNYQELGCNSFVWGRSSSKEKRKLHEKYYDKTFYFDNPPVIDEDLGITGFPRQIWNCKCHMLVKPPTLTEIMNKTEEVRNAKRNIFTRLQYKIRNSKQCNNHSWRYRRLGEG